MNKATFTSIQKIGFGVGKKIGYPTVNLVIPQGLKLGFGVYACRVRIKRVWFNGILYFGPHYIVDKSVITLEVHLLSSLPKEQGKLLSSLDKNERIAVMIGTFIRKPKLFKSIISLKNQIASDINKLTKKAVGKL